MPIVPTQEILGRAFRDRYGVAAINVVNDLTLEAVLAAAEEARAPLIVQTSVKTVVMEGAEVLYAMWVEMTPRHHGPGRAPPRPLPRSRGDLVVPRARLELGAVRRVEAERRGEPAAVRRGGGRGPALRGRGRGRDRGHPGRRGRRRVRRRIDDPVARRGARLHPRRPGVDCFAPAIGNAHGMYRTTPSLDNQRVTDIVAAAGIPIALHGGTGMPPEQFSDLIARGCAKVNISTALKIRFMQSGFDYMTAQPGRVRPAGPLPQPARRRDGHGHGPHPDVRQRRARPGDHAHLRLRRRARGHGALRPPAGLQPDVRGVRAAGHLVGRGVRASW